MNSLKSLEKPKSKNVIKPILENPFVQQNFPEIPESTSKSIRDFLLHNLQQISHYSKAKNTKGFKGGSIPVPPFYERLTLGFNPTVSQLEAQVKAFKENKELSTETTKDFIKYVLICKDDTKPQILLQHFPALTYLSSPDHYKVKLITLPKGTINQIESIIGKKITIIGMKENEMISKDFRDLMDTVSNVDVPWLRDFKFQKTRVKMLQTTMPLGKKVKAQKILKKSKNIKRST
ncbi:hypothetical protein WICPIJ_009619 [Wickerhamomyces pijperi]|uniref:Uncharacterized protein n=1 Tax=Wickerhamomyces pijperi TaxID=599730 RepID=A0A9P8PLK5_WICPI|nr:hypothetical protein WICPIJ_009619 [Wickerhamomyces pijperi]